MIPRKYDFDLFDDMFDAPFFHHHENKIMRTDIVENDDDYNIMIDLPGYNKEDIKIDVEDGYLNITAELNKNEDHEEKGKYVRRERFFGKCSRSFYVGDIDVEDIKAAFKNGILTLTIPKMDNEKESSKKYIQIDE